jgi:hypothetical protein
VSFDESRAAELAPRASAFFKRLGFADEPFFRPLPAERMGFFVAFFALFV